ncbi:MmgE/PrpD family protein [Erythrobacter sp. JK5]|uniref:MmgE/PrpD family protein n=1 Tax=Erythrobacter sp. JK5 TaxID=2829500 RepID=UPI001BAA28AC|nr:MmgE/PrpD family protein [Erythrobacter sp. JK5]QUL36964.1 MmgE/PrpD family protein [Erythrobacter sp. JK5]
MSATADLLEFAAADHALSEAVRADAVRLLSDTLAVGAAGATAPGADAILAAARAMGSGEESRVVGSDERLPAPGAAFVNGYRIHSLEWDAVHEPAVVHALSTVVAALGAAIDRKGGCDPEEALIALAVGVDVAAGLGLAADSALTFFRPATAGVIGAALAVARIDGAPMDEALGIAYSSAAGTMQAHVEGLATLPFQIANAARAAVTASDLAKAGFPGPKDPLEGEFGYFKLFDSGDLSRYTRDLGNIWRISEVSVKPFPSGRASHALVAAIQDLSLRPPDVKSLSMKVPPLVHRLIGRPFKVEMTPAYARLCGQFLGALTIRDGLIDPRRFTPETFADRELAELAGRISIRLDDNADPNALSPQEMVVELRDGHIVVEVPHTLGSPQSPLSDTQAEAKRTLARELAPDDADPRIFDDPLAYFTDPQ